MRFFLSYTGLTSVLDSWNLPASIKMYFEEGAFAQQVDFQTFSFSANNAGTPANLDAWVGSIRNDNMQISLAYTHVCPPPPPSL